jgi:hypothetical protein
MEVYKLTEEQKNNLTGQSFDGEQLFNPTLDADDNWFISIEEITYCTNQEFLWVKDLPTIEHNPIIREM